MRYHRATGTFGERRTPRMFHLYADIPNTPNTPNKRRVLLYPSAIPANTTNWGHLRIDYYIRPYYSAMFTHAFLKLP